MAKGEWIQDREDINGVLPLIISEEFGSYQYQAEFNGSLVFEHNEIPVKFKIAGVLKSPGMYLDFNVGGTDVATNHLLRNHKAEYSGVPMFFINTARLPSCPQENVHSSSIVFFEDTLSERERNSNLKILSAQGNVSTLSDIAARGEAYAKGYITLYLPLFLCGFVIAFVGMVGLSILNVQKNMRQFSIYYFLGCRWGKIANLCLGVTAIQLTITTVILGAFFLYFAVYADLTLYGVRLNWWNLVITLLIYLFVGLVTYLIPKIVLARNSAMDTFRANLQS